MNDIPRVGNSVRQEEHFPFQGAEGNFKFHTCTGTDSEGITLETQKILEPPPAGASLAVSKAVGELLEAAARQVRKSALSEKQRRPSTSRSVSAEEKLPKLLRRKSICSPRAPSTPNPKRGRRPRGSDEGSASPRRGHLESQGVHNQHRPVSSWLRTVPSTSKSTEQTGREEWSFKMFYSTQILAKKGPLGTIWIAAHLERRLKRNQVFETSITISVDSIINPEAPLALRLSGQLLLGVVRVYSRKVGYLFQDCNDTLLKIKSAFTQQGLVDLPADKVSADISSITLPENYDTIEIRTTSNGPISLMLDGDSHQLSDDLTFTVRDESITLDANYNALSFDAAPAHDEVFEGAGDLDLDLENVDYNTDEDMVDEPERLRAAETPGEASNLDLGTDNADGKQTPGLGTPGILPGVDDEAAPIDEAADIPMGADTPANDDDDLGLGRDEDTPALPGNTPGMDELGVLGDTPADDGMDADDAPELGNSGIVTESAPWGEAGAKQQARATQQRAAKRVEVQVDDGAGGREAAELPGQAIRALLMDRAPLLMNRGFRGGMNKKRDARADRKRKQMHDQGLLDKSAVPGPVSGVLANLWQDANTVAITTREQIAQNEKEERQTAKRARNARKEVEEAPANVQETEAEEVPEVDEPNDMDGQFAGDSPMAENEPDVEIIGHDAADDDEVEVVGHYEDDEIEFTAADQVAEEEVQVVSEEEDSMPRAVELLQSGDQEQEQPGTSDVHATTFTANTRAVLKHIRGMNGNKLAREAETGHKDRDGIVGLNKLVAGKKRLDAARWFFELLVLKSKDYVNLDQKEAYGDIKIKAGPKISSAIH